jgi:hypothetical protein
MTYDKKLRQCESHKPIRISAHWKRAASSDPDLIAVINVWHRLPEGVQQPIVMLAQAASGGGPY